MKKLLIGTVVGLALAGMMGCDERQSVIVDAGYWGWPSYSDVVVIDDGYCDTCGYDSGYSYDEYGYYWP